ncbi:MAG: shikimate kinase, partial [Verrucomicrobia bacterium]|nr:shikimate kinase [Verrucomicrobiota bacterium]
MKRVLIFGNSGSGKSTLAHAYAKRPGVKYLDLDNISWKQDRPGVREEDLVSIMNLDSFTAGDEQWVIEGCYSGLIAHTAKDATEMIFMNPGIEVWIENCKSRPWEPHKYPSKEEQDKNLEMLLDWVREYETRKDEFSFNEHRKLFRSFPGNKVELLSNQ